MSARYWIAWSREGRGVAAFMGRNAAKCCGTNCISAGLSCGGLPSRARPPEQSVLPTKLQVGFGRLGTHFWGFETQGVVPDIAVFGKPIGNAFPPRGGGSPRGRSPHRCQGYGIFQYVRRQSVACAAGLAVLDVVRDEALQDRALRVGNYWITELQKLQDCHRLIGDVRRLWPFSGNRPGT